MKVAYLSNSFPEPVESYVWKEVRELRSRNCEVLQCSIRRPANALFHSEMARGTLYLFPLRPVSCLKASWVCIFRFLQISGLVARIIFGSESVSRKLRAIVHTWVGAYLFVLLRDKNISHIHIHHGYFSSWVGMVAAQLLGVNFSMTLHGSDLLMGADYLDAKLKQCAFCLTVSEFNRNFLLKNYPQVDSRKILVQHLGVDMAQWIAPGSTQVHEAVALLSVGRLHAVKNHAFLVLACRMMKSAGVKFRCDIAGEGGERPRLEELIQDLDLQEEVHLLGHVPCERLPELYERADIVALTSHSEGLPVTLMEAMAMEQIVLAPKITGIPELVVHGETGFLYEPQSVDHFVGMVRLIKERQSSLATVRKAARRRVQQYFNEEVNLPAFAKVFIEHVRRSEPDIRFSAKGSSENPVLQQI